MVKKLTEVPAGLVEETKAVMRLYLFLRYDCGLRGADNLEVRELREFLGCIYLSKTQFDDKI